MADAMEAKIRGVASEAFEDVFAQKKFETTTRDFRVAVADALNLPVNDIKPYKEILKTVLLELLDTKTMPATEVASELSADQSAKEEGAKETKGDRTKAESVALPTEGADREQQGKDNLTQNTESGEAAPHKSKENKETNADSADVTSAAQKGDQNQKENDELTEKNESEETKVDESKESQNDTLDVDQEIKEALDEEEDEDEDEEEDEDEDEEDEDEDNEASDDKIKLTSEERRIALEPLEEMLRKDVYGIYDRMPEDVKESGNTIVWGKFNRDWWPCYVWDPREYPWDYSQKSKYLSKCKKEAVYVLVLWLDQDLYDQRTLQEGMLHFKREVKDWETGTSLYLKSSKKKSDFLGKAYGLGMMLASAKPHIRLKPWRKETRKEHLTKDLLRQARQQKKLRLEKMKSRKTKAKKKPSKGGKMAIKNSRNFVADQEPEVEDYEQEDEQDLDVDEAQMEAQDDDDAFVPDEEDRMSDEDIEKPSRKRQSSNAKNLTGRSSKRRKKQTSVMVDEFEEEDDYNEKESAIRKEAIDVEMEVLEPGWCKKLKDMSKRERALARCSGCVKLWGGAERALAEARGGADKSKKQLGKVSSSGGKKIQPNKRKRSLVSAQRKMEELRNQYINEKIEELNRDPETRKLANWEKRQEATKYADERLNINTEFEAAPRKKRRLQGEDSTEPDPLQPRNPAEKNDPEVFLKRLVRMCEVICEKRSDDIDANDYKRVMKRIARFENLTRQMIKASGLQNLIKKNMNSYNPRIKKMATQMRNHMKSVLASKKVANIESEETKNTSSTEKKSSLPQVEAKVVDEKASSAKETSNSTATLSEVKLKAEKNDQDSTEVDVQRPLTSDLKGTGGSLNGSHKKEQSSKEDTSSASTTVKTEEEEKKPKPEEGKTIPNDAKIAESRPPKEAEENGIAKTKDVQEEPLSGTRAKLCMLLGTIMETMADKVGLGPVKADDSRLLALEKYLWDSSAGDGTQSEEQRMLLYAEKMRLVAFGCFDNTSRRPLATKILREQLDAKAAFEQLGAH